MKQRKPMSRGAGFARPRIERRPPSAPTPATRRAVLADCAGLALAMPKPIEHRNRRLLDMARGKPCLLLIPGVCRGETETTVAAHSNLAIHGKAMARKAQDFYSCWCCARCHSWLDQGSASAAEKELAFMLAHMAQVCEWRAIAGSTKVDPLDQAAAIWALHHLNATPVGQTT